MAVKCPEFHSTLAPYMSDFLEQKRKMGYKYETAALILARFDRYCIDHNLEGTTVTKEFLTEWSIKKDSEKIGNVNKRLTVISQFFKYAIPLGLDMYIPAYRGREDNVLPHLFSEEELCDFFAEVDRNVSSVQAMNSYIRRMANEYRVLFRMYACCGLRNSEACTIKKENVDLENGILTILNSKGNKDRVVYMPDDLTVMCKQYYEALTRNLGFRPTYFFPGMDPSLCIPNTSVDTVFTRFWSRTKYASCCNNKPTVHDFRFTFITKRMNDWAKNGLPVNQLLPYLSVYCGHKSMQETYYYYHTYKDMYDSINQKDKTSSYVIPEVRSYG